MLNTKNFAENNKPTLLLLENDGLVRKMIERNLGNDYNIYALMGGPHVVSLYRPNKFDLIMTNHKMFGEDFTGLELSKQIKAINPLQTIVVHSGLVGKELEDKYRSVGVEHFIPKPSSGDLLKTLLESALKSRAVSEIP